jgi:hypothetical protein
MLICLAPMLPKPMILSANAGSQVTPMANAFMSFCWLFFAFFLCFFGLLYSRGVISQKQLEIIVKTFKLTLS